MVISNESTRSDDTFVAETTQWLMKCDQPGVRYLALKEILGLQESDPAVETARNEAYQSGPIAKILECMQPDGYWVEPGAGYRAKYRSGTWSLVTLAQLGASVGCDARIRKACDYLMEHSFLPGGQFSMNGTPSMTIDCLQGNLCWALYKMGYDDPRLEQAYEWMARTVTGEGIANVEDRKARRRYYAGKCGPLFACGANDKRSCAWGGIKVMMGFSVWPEARRTSLIKEAIHQGAEFLLNGDPAHANYPNGYSPKPSSNWWKFGFPVFYITDLLQNVEALASLGYGRDPRLTDAIQIVREKADMHGRWMLEYDYAGKTWTEYGAKNQPNPWVTIRALRTLRALNSKAH